MDHFIYKNNHLYAEEVAIADIATAVGTPFYCYSQATLSRHYNVFDQAFAGSNKLICFAVKANSNIAVLRLLGQLGAGADCVSEGEIRRALAAEIPASRIVFSGVGKTEREMTFALQNNIFQFNIESEPELELLNHVAISLKTKAPIAVRVNPDVDAKTHDKISTGRKDDKFGIALEYAYHIYQKASQLEGIAIKGIATHIGSQLTDMVPFQQAFSKLCEFTKTLKLQGVPISRLDLGGGLGIPYANESPPLPDQYAKTIKAMTNTLDCLLMFEPGRLICGNAGILVSQVIYIKETAHKRFVIIDAAMNDLLRPAMYHAYHMIIPVAATSRETIITDIVGPVCESSDCFAKNREISKVAPGDLLAIRSAGAYGFTMASEYNTRPLPAEVLVRDNQYAVIRARNTYEAMLAQDKLPHWS